MRRGQVQGAIVCLVIGLCMARPGAALRPTVKYSSTPEMAKIAYDDVTLSTRDGILLHAWFMPFQDQEGRAFRDPGPIVILPTDGSDNMGSVLWHYYNFFRGTPWHVLTFDWRGFGTSEAWGIDTTQVVIPEFRTDLAGAIEYAKNRPEFDGENIAIFATGPAAAVALAVASERNDIRALALRGVYSTEAEFCANLTRSGAMETCGRGSRWPAAKEPIRVAGQVRVPTFIVVGDSDKFSPPAMAQAVHDSLSGERELWVAPSAGHSGYESPEFVHMKPFAVKLHGFLKSHIGTAGH